jgi:hypothetical protein
MVREEKLTTPDRFELKAIFIESFSFSAEFGLETGLLRPQGSREPQPQTASAGQHVSPRCLHFLWWPAAALVESSRYLANVMARVSLRHDVLRIDAGPLVFG